MKFRVTGVHVNQFQVTHIKKNIVMAEIFAENVGNELLSYEKDDLIIFIHHIQVVMM